MGWDGMGWDDGMEWDNGMGWDGFFLGCNYVGRVEGVGFLYPLLFLF